MKRLLTAGEVAETLSVDASTVHRWARTGDLPSLRLGPGTIRFDPDALERWISGHQVGKSVLGTPLILARPGRVDRLRAAVTARTHVSTGRP